MQEIDRLSPTLEPNGTPLMHQNWHHLLFLHWEVPPMELQPLLPPGLELDTFEGKSYVGLVPFTMTGVRPILVPPLPLLSSFHEVNVRTYVHRQGRDPGVWFFSLDASSSIAVEAARTLFKLPYFHSEIELEVSKEANPRVEFRSRRVDPRGAMPADSLIRYGGVEGPATPASPGTLDHFLVERYILYAADQQKNLYSGRVHHQPYPLQRADVETLEETLTWAAGIRRSQDVPLRHYAREVNVRVYGLERC